MKCEICRKQISETFLKKLVGTMVKDKNGKLHPVCQECQKKLRKKEDIISAINK